MGLDLFKLEKLKISGFKNVERGGKAPAVFEAMFNPASLSQTYAIVWGSSGGTELSYSRSAPGELSLDLILDGTGVSEMGAFALAQKSVTKRVKEFLDIAYHYDGAIHEANYLVVEWGKLPPFPCRLSSVTINYTLFDRDGSPLRAELKVQLVSDESAKKAAKESHTTSPDLTHSRVVRRGDTLPLLTKAIYGSSAWYVDVARWNGLDDFRDLTPGQTLLFPPLVAFGAGAGASRRG